MVKGKRMLAWVTLVTAQKKSVDRPYILDATRS